MTSNAYVWTWLPGTSTPVVAGIVDTRTREFRYGRSYLDNPVALPIGPGLPLRDGVQLPENPDLPIHGPLLDALPDRWGQRILELQLKVAEPSMYACMLHADSNRFGAIDFQSSPSNYTHRGSKATLDELHAAAQLIDQGEVLPSNLDLALRHGTSIGGARPKAQLVDGFGNEWIAKFSSTTDTLPVVQAEAVALELADRAGVQVAEHDLTESLGKQVLLVKRFDRTPSGGRRHTVSMLTTLRLTEMTGRYATYPDFLDEIGAQHGEELFRRVAFNIAIGNTDDHARNHAAFWDGTGLSLTPAYDLDPTARGGGWDSNQAIAFTRSGNRRSNLADLLDASGDFHVGRHTAEEIVDMVRGVIETGWVDACDAAKLPSAASRAIRARAVLHEAAVEGLVRPTSFYGAYAPPDLSAFRPPDVPRAGVCGAPTLDGTPCRRRGRCPHHHG